MEALSVRVRHESALETLEAFRHTPTPAEELLGLWPVVVGITQAKPAYRNRRRVAPYHSLHLILRGTLHWESAHTAPQTLGAGDLFCLFPEVTHSYHAAAKDPQRMMYLAIDGAAAGPTISMLGLTAQQPILRGLPVKRFLGHLRLMQTAFDAVEDARAMLPTEYLARFLGEILAATAGNRPHVGPASLLERGRAFIDTHCTEDITVEDVAHHVGLTRSHFSTAFTRRFEVTPRDYLWSRRLDRGRDLLRSTDLGVTEVAFSVGFSDIYAFSHAYRRRFGSSPSADRHQ